MRERSEMLVRLDCYSGLRAGELARLRREDVDLDGSVLRVRWLEEALGQVGRIKTKHERLVPLCAPLRDLLEQLFVVRPGRYLLRRDAAIDAPVGVRRLNADLAWARSRAGLPWVTLHTLRHTRASWWVQGGAPIAKVAHWLGHSPEVCARFYAGLAAGYDADAESMPTSTVAPIRVLGPSLASVGAG